MLAKTSVRSDIVKVPGVNAKFVWVITIPLLPFMDIFEYQKDFLSFMDQAGNEHDYVRRPPVGPWRPDSFQYTINVIEKSFDEPMILESLGVQLIPQQLLQMIENIDGGFNGYSFIEFDDLPAEYKLIGTSETETKITHGTPIMGFSITRMQNNNAQPGYWPPMPPVSLCSINRTQQPQQ